MPKIKPNTQKRKMTITRRPVLIVAIILVIAIITLILAKILTDNAADSENQSDDTTSEVATQTEALGATNESADANVNDYNNPQTPKQYEGDNANTYDNLTGSVTYAEVSGDSVIIGTNIDQFLSTGTCTLTMTSGSSKVTKTANIVADPTTSSCDGFTIPLAELSSGSWEINIDLSSNNKTGTISGKVNI